MKKFKEAIIDIAKRTIKTFCESLAGFVIVGTAIQNIDWPTALSVSATAAVLTILVNIVAKLNADVSGKDNGHEEEL